MNLRNSCLTLMRTTVSADKHRFNGSGFDLDLTYITDRVIAMSFPAEGLEATYRNDIDDVSVFLDLKHKNKFKIYNLTERQYDYTKFGNNNVEGWCGWPDHHSPPLITLLQLMNSIHKYLASDPENVVAIHCLAGKGRTGTVIACYMLFAGLFDQGCHARNYFGYKRSNTNWGVVGPAQVRTVDYMANILQNGMPQWTPLRLKEIIMNKIPKLYLGPGKSSGCSPLIAIHEYNAIKLPQEQPLIWTNATHLRRKDCITVVAFNTAIIVRDNPDLRVRFQKVDIDKANNDTRFPYDFWLEFVFEAVPPGTQPTVPFDHDKLRIDPEFWTSILSLHTDALNGSICFNNEKIEEKLAEAKSFRKKKGERVEANAALMNKGGWITKQGSNF